jgi:hypothetical protein
MGGGGIKGCPTEEGIENEAARWERCPQISQIGTDFWGRMKKLEVIGTVRFF